MTADSDTRMHEALTAALALLDEQLREALLDSVRASGADRARAKQVVQDLEAQRDGLQRKFATRPHPALEHRSSDNQGSDPKAVRARLEKDLRKIDFKSIEDAIRGLLKAREPAERSGLLVLGRCGMMGGELCLERIRDILQSSTRYEKFRRIEIGFQPWGERHDEGLLRRLGEVLGWGNSDPIPTEPVLVERLRGLLENGSILLLDIRGCDHWSQDHSAALEKLVTDFWQRLDKQLESTAGELGTISVLVVLSFDCELPKAILAEHFRCRGSRFQRGRALVLNLKRWPHDDVREWLDCYGLPPGHPPIETARLVSDVVQAAEGFPTQIAFRLLSRCEPLWSSNLLQDAL
jgi:hypothetical protein